MRMLRPILTLIATALIAAHPAFGGDMACCAGKTGKMECSHIYAKLNLTPEQKSKLDAFQTKCEKGGCTAQSMDKFFSEAKGILSPEQFAQLKSECSKMEQKPAKADG